jgi:hypothetical protein
MGISCWGMAKEIGGRPPTPLGILPPNASDQALGLAVVERKVPVTSRLAQPLSVISTAFQVCSFTCFSGQSSPWGEFLGIYSRRSWNPTYARFFKVFLNLNPTNSL